jgi:hypothetical protein
MTREQEDFRARKFFEQVRAEDRAGTPTFEKVLGRQPRGAVWRWPLGFQARVALAVCLVCAILVPVWLQFGDWSSNSDDEYSEGLITWEAPTDFLLTYNRSPLESTVPSIDVDPLSWTEDEDQGPSEP